MDLGGKEVGGASAGVCVCVCFWCVRNPFLFSERNRSSHDLPLVMDWPIDRLNHSADDIELHSSSFGLMPRLVVATGRNMRVLRRSSNRIDHHLRHNAQPLGASRAQLVTAFHPANDARAALISILARET